MGPLDPFLKKDVTALNLFKKTELLKIGYKIILEE